MKIGVFTVCVPDYEPIEAIEKLKAMGFDGVEWRVTKDEGDKNNPSFWSGNRATFTAGELIENAESLKAKCNEVGMEMPSIAAYIDCNDLSQVELHLKAAAAVGAGAVRIGPGQYDREGLAYPQQVEKAARQYAKVADLARKYGVRALIETHMNQLAPSITKAMNILRGLDPKHVGIMWDPANQIYEGLEMPQMAIAEAGQYLGEVHVKNAVNVKEQESDEQTIWKTTWASVRHGCVNWPEIIAELKKANYDGWLMFEDFSTTAPREKQIADNLNWFRKLIEQ